MKRLLILGASILQLPAIKKAKKMGLYVGVIDYNRNAIGVSYADKFYEVSTIDKEGIYQVALDFKPDGIMTLATDMPIRSVAYVVERLNLTGISYAAAMNSTDKLKMIQKFKEYDVAHPWFLSITKDKNINDLKKKLKYPCVCKPVDSSGSRGVTLIKNETELEEDIFYSMENSYKKEVILEEFLVGNEVSVEIIVDEEDIHILNITDKITTGAPYFVELGHTQPSNLALNQLKEIEILAKKGVEALGINKGAAHVEIMYTEKGPKIIEIGARMGGDCISTFLIPLSTGIDMTEAVINISLNEKPKLVKTKNQAAAIRYMDAKKGKIKYIEGIEKARLITGVVEINLSKSEGDYYNGIKSSGDRIGYVISTAKTYDAAILICEEALKRIKIFTEE